MNKEVTTPNERGLADCKTGEQRKQAFKDVQQPIAPDGYENKLFTQLYGRNPFTGTERDRSKRRKYY